MQMNRRTEHTYAECPSTFLLKTSGKDKMQNVRIDRSVREMFGDASLLRSDTRDNQKYPILAKKKRLRCTWQAILNNLISILCHIRA